MVRNAILSPIPNLLVYDLDVKYFPRLVCFIARSLVMGRLWNL